MKNIDKIKQMNAGELARFILLHDKCDSCSLESRTEGCHMKCVQGITEWLNQEVNPMLEIKVNDLLTFADKSTGIVVGNDMVYFHFKKERYFLKSLIKSCIKIRRYNILRDEWKIIWRADDV